MNGQQEARENANLVNREGIEDLKDLNNLEIRGILTEGELIADGYVISPDDYEAVKRRAEMLLNGAEPLSAEAAVLTAAVERFQLMDKLGEEALKEMPVDSLRAIFYAESQTMFTDEEIELFKGSELPFEQWLTGRMQARQTLH